MVTSGLAVWKPAIQASWAASCEEAPAPTRVPERLEADSAGAAPPSFAAQELSASAAVTAMAAGTPKRLRFT